MTENIEGLPKPSSYGNSIQIEKVDWALMQMTLKLKPYNSMSDLNLSNIALPVAALECNDMNCMDAGHYSELCNLYCDIINSLNNASKPLIKTLTNCPSAKPEWNDHVWKPAAAKEAFKWWVLGKPRNGPECALKNVATARFKYALRFVKRNEQAMRANSMAKKLQKNYICDFWKEVKVLNNSKMQMPSSIEGITELGEDIMLMF